MTKNKYNQKYEEKEIEANFIKKRVLFMEGDFNEKSVNKLIKQFMLLLDESRIKPITLYIDSYGGEVYSFMSLFSLLKNRKFKLTTVVMGKAMSAGSYLHLLGDERIAYPYATLMYHQMSLGKSGKLNDINIYLKNSNREQDIMNRLVEDVSKITDAKLWLESNKYLSPLEAKRLGLITKIKKVY